MGNEKRQSSDFLLVIIGLLAGFFLGAGIVYWYSNQPLDSFTTDRALERLSRIFQSGDSDKQNTGTASLSDKNIIQKQRVDEQSNRAINPSDTAVVLLETESIESDVLASYLDSIEKLDYTDIFIDDDTYYAVHTDSLLVISDLPPARKEEIRIARDRLIGVKGYSVPVDRAQKKQSESSRKLDSLIGVSEPLPDFRIFYVEFWESPLNYSAYKMGSNRIILYGFDQIDEISLQLIGSTVFLKYFENYFGLTQTAEFKPLVPVSSDELLTKLEQLWP